MKQNWEYKKLGEIGTFLRGSGILKTDFVDHGMPCIHYGQIHTKFDVSVNHHLSEISKDLFDKSKIANPGDIILAITSEDIEGSCKCVAWLGDYDIAVSAHAAIFKHHENPKFLSYSFRSDTFSVQKAKYARGFKVMEIKPSDVALITIPVPPLSTQTAIVSELDALSAIIADHKSLLKKYDELEQSIFYHMFGDPVKNDKGWEVKTLKEICRQIGDGLHGTPEYSTERSKFYFINGNNLNDGKIEIKESTKTVTESSFQQHFIELDAKTLLISINGTLGKVAFYRNESIILGKSACYLKVGDSIDITYLYRLLSSSYFKDYMESECTGTTIRNVSLKSMRTFSCPLPPLPLQQEFASKIEAIEAMKADTKKSLAKSEELFNARMDYYFNA